MIDWGWVLELGALVGWAPDTTWRATFFELSLAALTKARSIRGPRQETPAASSEDVAAFFRAKAKQTQAKLKGRDSG